MTWLIGASAFTLICLAAGTAFVLWLLWSLFWHLFDTRMENSKRIANEQLDSAHVTGQFHTPTFSQRDFK